MGLLDLPPELRNNIYEQVLTCNGTIEIRHRHLFEIQLGYYRVLSQVSKRIRSECLPVYYANNAFLFRSLNSCVAWLELIGSDCRHLKDLRFAEGVLEGIAWSASRDSILRHGVNVSSRLCVQGEDKTEPTLSSLTAWDEVDEEMKTNALNRLKSIEDVTKDLGALDILISGTIHHCKHCSSGLCKWCRHTTCCDKDRQNESE